MRWKNCYFPRPLEFPLQSSPANVNTMTRRLAYQHCQAIFVATASKAQHNLSIICSLSCFVHIKRSSLQCCEVELFLYNIVWAYESCILILYTQSRPTELSPIRTHTIYCMVGVRQHFDAGLGATICSSFAFFFNIILFWNVYEILVCYRNICASRGVVGEVMFWACALAC